nr:hypothetical protein BaRGS_018534 [Batillaria attramentaria]
MMMEMRMMEQRSQSDPKIRKRSPRCFMSLMGRKWNRMSSNKKQQYFDKAKELLQHYIENQPEDTGTSKTQDPDVARSSGFAATEDTGTSKTPYPDLARSSGFAATEDTGTSKTPVKRRRKRPRRCPIVKKRVTWREVSDEGVQDEFTSQILVDGLLKNEPLVVREITGTSSCCRVTPYSRNVMSRVEQKFEIDKVFADAEVYFTASNAQIHEIRARSVLEIYWAAMTFWI